jgi:hypothetical protein
MLYRENFIVYVWDKYKYYCGQNVEFFTVKTHGTYINRQVLKG